MARYHCELLCLDLPTAERLRAERRDEHVATAVSRTAPALADPTRVTLAVALRDAEELCVCDLSWIAERSQNLVSYHMRALRTRGLVRSRRDGKMVMYALTDEGRTLVGALVGSPDPVVHAHV